LNENNRSIFKNRPLATALAFYMAGVIFSTILKSYYLYPLVLLLTASAAALYFYLKGNLRLAGIVLAISIFLLGWFRAVLFEGPFPSNHIANLAEIGGRATLFGKVVEEPDIREDRTYLVAEIDSLSIKKYTIPSFGRVRIKVLNGGARFDHADYIEARGILYSPEGPRNPGSFNYALYLRNKNIFAAMSVSGPNNVTIIRRGTSFLSSVVKPVRDYMIGTAREYLTPVSAAILSGFILGERRDIPDEYQTMFRDTGTLHLMAVSGSNVGLVVAVFAIPLTLVGLRRKKKVVILLAVIMFFAILTRLEPSVVRASVMASIALLAYGWLRKPDYINLLGFAGLVMLLWRPLQLFDVGLQLSFAATFGIVYAVPRLYDRLKPVLSGRLRLLRWVVVAIATTLAAQAAVMPLMALYFNRFPLIGLVANLPIGFLASLASVMGLVLYAVSTLGGLAGSLAAWPIEFILSSIKATLRFFSDFPLATMNTGSFDWPVIILYWITLYLLYELTMKRRVSRKGILVGLVFFNLLIWPRVFEKRPSWSLEFIDVGPNRAWFYNSKSGGITGCVDIYKEEEYAENTLVTSVLNNYGGRLTWLITTTPDSPAITALRDLFSPNFIDLSCEKGSDKAAGQLSDNFSSEYPEDIKFVWEQSDNTEKGNNIPPYLRIDVGNYCLLLAGRSGPQERRSLKADKRIALLELPWIEYARTECMKEINRMNPDCVVFSHDGNSRYAPRERSDLSHSADKLLSTSIYGGFQLSEIDGQMWISTMITDNIKE